MLINALLLLSWSAMPYQPVAPPLIDLKQKVCAARPAGFWIPFQAEVN